MNLAPYTGRRAPTKRSSFREREREREGSEQAAKGMSDWTVAGGEKATVTKEEVIAKLKDDGDFDNLRLKIIRKLKDNEELRGKVVAIVRQSAAINRPGVESARPRQLSDAIYDEVGNKVMGLVSDGLWKIIKSSDGGMKDEIYGTVQTVYNKLVDPGSHESGRGESSAHADGAKFVHNGPGHQGKVDSLSAARHARCSGGEQNGPSGNVLPSSSDNRSPENKEGTKFSSHLEGHVILEKEKSKFGDGLAMDDALGVPTGFVADDECKLPSDGSDEDPDVPPGFGD